MGACRLLVYLVSASVARQGVTGNVLWCGLALASYVLGVSLAGAEGKRARAGPVLAGHFSGGAAGAGRVER